MNNLFVSATQAIDFSRENETKEWFEEMEAELRSLGYDESENIEAVLYDIFDNKFFNWVADNFDSDNDMTATFPVIANEEGKIILNDVTTKIRGYRRDDEGHAVFDTDLGTVTLLK